jgi:hypothetical protein
MSDQHSFLSGDPYSRYQAAEHMLNTAITQARISQSFEEYLEIFDKFYADEVEVSSETQQEPIRGKARVGSLLLNFLIPLHVMAEVGGLAISIKDTTIPADAANEIHSAWTLNIVGVSGRTCTLNWRALRKWNGSRVVYEHHYDLQRSGEPLTFDDLGFDMIGSVAGFQGGGDRRSSAGAFIATWDRSVSSKFMSATINRTPIQLQGRRRAQRRANPTRNHS